MLKPASSKDAQEQESPSFPGLPVANTENVAPIEIYDFFDCNCELLNSWRGVNISAFPAPLSDGIMPAFMDETAVVIGASTPPEINVVDDAPSEDCE